MDSCSDEMHIDLDINVCWDILQDHGVVPTADLVHALWQWKDGQH